MPGASTTARGLPVVDLGSGLKGDPIPVPGDSPPSRDDTLASISSMLDNSFGTTRGGILYRGASSWALRAPGTSGFFLKSFGAGADPDYAAVAAGDVTGPGVAVDGDFAQFNGTTGKIIKDGGLSLDIDGTLAANSDTRIPSQKAVKTYVGAHSTAPGGSSGNVQYNNSGAFGGLTDVQLTARIVAFSSSLSGAVPSSGGGTANFLRADGSFAVPPGTAVVPTGANPSATASDAAVNGSAATFMRSDGAPAVQLGSNSQFGLAKGDGTTVSISAGVASVIGSGIAGTGSDADFDLMFFGGGTDGDVAISSGTTSLSRDMFYHNLTISGTGKLNLNGWRAYVQGTLDLTNAPAGAIVSINNLGSALNGGPAGSGVLGANGGAGGVSPTSTNTLGTGVGGGTGASGGTGAGTQAGAITASGNQIPNTAGAGGKGGNVGATAGGASRGGASGSFAVSDVRKLTDQLYVIQNTTVQYVKNGPGAPGGSSGAGDGVGSGGGAGGGGATPGVVWVAARTIARATGTTVARALNADGGAGGTGGLGTGGTNRGGGGGGGGAPGGWLYVIYRFLTGSAAANMLSASGGNGGTGGNGTGTGIGGDGGAAGSRGRIDIYCLATGTWTHSEADTTTVAGTAGSGATGGPGGTANTQFQSL